MTLSRSCGARAMTGLLGVVYLAATGCFLQRQLQLVLARNTTSKTAGIWGQKTPFSQFITPILKASEVHVVMVRGTCGCWRSNVG